MSPATHAKAKLPVQQLTILAVVRFAEPLALTSVFPYLPEMIKSFGVPENNVAKWAGMIGSTFSVSQSLCAVLWGGLSDKIGRKPTILIGLINVMFCFLLWGTSTTLTQAFVSRFLMGLGNGNVGIIRTMVAEMVPWKELQPRAFSLMPLVWNIGSIFGPSFGGFFARPAQQYPALFGDSWLFNKYPFLLPNLVAGVFFAISVIVATLFLRETLETKRDEKDWGIALGEKISRPFTNKKKRHHAQIPAYLDTEASAPLLASSNNNNNNSINKPTNGGVEVTIKSKSKRSSRQPTMREIFTFQVIINIVTYTFLALHAVAFDQLLPAFLDYPRVQHTPDNTHLPFNFSGGYGLDSSEIGTIFTVYGLACGIIQFFLFPIVCGRFGALNCFKAGTLIFPLVYFAIPFTALIENPTHQFTALIILLIIKGFAVIVGFPCLTILLTNAAPTLRILGTINGFAVTFSGLGRAVGPTVSGLLFSWGVKRNSVIPAFWFLGVVALGQIVPTWYIVEGDGPSREDSEEDGASSEDSEESEGETRSLLAGRDVASDEEEEDEEGFSPLARVHSQVPQTTAGYGTIQKRTERG